MRYLLTVFITVFFAELGDKTQFAVLLYSTRPEISKVGIAVAASLALVTATIIATFLGERLSHWINPRILTGVAGAGFILIGMWLLYSLTRGA